MSNYYQGTIISEKFSYIECLGERERERERENALKDKFCTRIDKIIWVKTGVRRCHHFLLCIQSR